MTTYRIYTRLSQYGTDDSIDNQVNRVLDYCDTHGLDVDVDEDWYNDGRRVSGFGYDDRPEYRRLRDELRGGEIDGVVVRDRARLSRDFDERVRLVLWFRANDVELHVVEDGGRVHLEDHQTAAMEMMRAYMDYAAKKQEIERVKRMLSDRAERGAYQGKPPYGLQFGADGDCLVADGEEFGDALEILRVLDEQGSIRGTARELDVPRSRVRRVRDKQDWYRAVEAGAVIGREGPFYSGGTAGASDE